MKFQNRPLKKYFKVLYVMIYMFLFLNVLGIFFIQDNSISTQLLWFLPIPIALFVLLTYLGTPVFIYDSDGETLIIHNEKGSHLSLDSQKRADFPKMKLKKYIFQKSFLRKELIIHIHSKKNTNGLTKIKFPISYVSSKKITEIHKSLEKIIVKNEKINTREELQKEEI